MADKSIIDRIKKLLALAESNPEAGEAVAAALKAQKLIADYGVSKEELHEDEPEDIEEVENLHNIKGNPWGKSLASAIADNFRCRWYINYEGTRSIFGGRARKTKESITFIGYKTDAEAARVTYDKLYEIGNRLAGRECRKSMKEFGTAQGVRNSFLMGYVKGIRDELEKQSVALMLVRPKVVDDYADDRMQGFATSHSSVRNASYGGAYDNGRSAGRDSVRSARLGGRAALNA